MLLAPDGEREIVALSWDFFLLQARPGTAAGHQRRDDTILKSPFWRDSFEQRRCLVPVTAFCEPNGDIKPAT